MQLLEFLVGTLTVEGVLNKLVPNNLGDQDYDLSAIALPPFVIGQVHVGEESSFNSVPHYLVGDNDFLDTSSRHPFKIG